MAPTTRILLPLIAPNSTQFIRSPAMILGGERDIYALIYQDAQYVYEQLAGQVPVVFPVLKNGTHCFLESRYDGDISESQCHMADLDPLLMPRAKQIGITRQYSTAFFKLHLANDLRAADVVWGTHMTSDTNFVQPVQHNPLVHVWLSSTRLQMSEGNSASVYGVLSSCQRGGAPMGEFELLTDDLRSPLAVSTYPTAVTVYESNQTSGEFVVHIYVPRTGNAWKGFQNTSVRIAAKTLVNGGLAIAYAQIDLEILAKDSLTIKYDHNSQYQPPGYYDCNGKATAIPTPLDVSSTIRGDETRQTRDDPPSTNLSDPAVRAYGDSVWRTPYPSVLRCYDPTNRTEYVCNGTALVANTLQFWERVTNGQKLGNIGFLEMMLTAPFQLPFADISRAVVEMRSNVYFLENTRAFEKSVYSQQVGQE